MIQVRDGTRTKQQILDTAERLFSERGFDAISLRGITAEAGVNLAAINYHFRSKDALIEAVIMRRAEPLNRERIALLDAVESGTEGRPSLDAVLLAFIAPAFHIATDPELGGAVFCRLIGRVFTEADELWPRLLKERFVEVRERFVGALARAVPDLPLDALFWNLLFTVGAMAHGLRSGPGLRALTDGACGSPDQALTVQRLVTFAAAGFRAAAAKETHSHVQAS